MSCIPHPDLVEHGAPAADLPGFTHGFAEVNSTRLHYVIGGQGPLVMLLHGWPFNWAEWRSLMPYLVSYGYRVVAPDLRGFGRSARPDSGYDKRGIAADIDALIFAIGGTDVSLLGSDIGGMVAYAFADAYSDRLRHLVLAETLIPGYELEERMNPAKGGYWHFGFHMQVELATTLTAGKEADYLMPMWTMMSAAPDAQSHAASHYLPYFLQPGAMRAGFQHYATLIEDGNQNREQLPCKWSGPTLVLGAAKGIPVDQIVSSVRRMGLGFAEDVVPNAGHSFGHDNPEWVAKRLDRFFRNNE